MKHKFFLIMSNPQKVLAVIANTSKKSFRSVSQALKIDLDPSQFETHCIQQRKSKNVEKIRFGFKRNIAFDSTVPEPVITSYLESLRRDCPAATIYAVGIHIPNVRFVPTWNELTKLILN